MNKFFQIKNQTEKSADLLFYGDIVSSSDTFFGSEEDKCPSDIAEFLKNEEGKDLNIYINSCGGNVFAGFAIYNQLKRYSGHKTVYVDGLAGSIASVIAFAGDEIIMPSNSYLMIHKPFQAIIGNADELRKTADDLDRIEEGILNVYSEHLLDGISAETISEMMKNETWLSAEASAGLFRNITVESEKKAVAYCGLNNEFINIPKEIKDKTSANIQALEDARKKISSLKERI